MTNTTETRIEAIYQAVLAVVAFQTFTPNTNNGLDELEVLALVGADRAGMERKLPDGSILYRLYC